MACLSFKDWLFVASQKVLAISKFVWNESVFWWIYVSSPLKGSKWNCLASANWLSHFCTYNFFCSTGQRQVCIKNTWHVHGSFLNCKCNFHFMGTRKTKLGNFLLWNKFVENKYSLQNFKENLTIALKSHID